MKWLNQSYKCLLAAYYRAEIRCAMWRQEQIIESLPREARQIRDAAERIRYQERSRLTIQNINSQIKYLRSRLNRLEDV